MPPALHISYLTSDSCLVSQLTCTCYQRLVVKHFQSLPGWNVKVPVRSTSVPEAIFVYILLYYWYKWYTMSFCSWCFSLYISGQFMTFPARSNKNKNGWSFSTYFLWQGLQVFARPCPIYPYAGDISYQVISVIVAKSKLTRGLNVISFHVRTQYHNLKAVKYKIVLVKILSPPFLTAL